MRVLQRRPAAASPSAARPSRGRHRSREPRAGGRRRLDRLQPRRGRLPPRVRARRTWRPINVGGVENVLAAARDGGRQARRPRLERRVRRHGRATGPRRSTSARRSPSAPAGTRTSRRSARGEEVALAAAADGPGRRRRLSGLRDRRGRRQPHLDVRRRAVPARRAALRDGRRSQLRRRAATWPRASCSSSARGSRASATSSARPTATSPTSSTSTCSARSRASAASRCRSRRRCWCRRARVLRALHVPLPVHPDELDSSRWYWYSTPQRAIDELGYAPRPVREAVESTVSYLRERGMRGR